MKINVSENNGTVAVNLVRTGDLFESITVCIRITMLVDPANVQRRFVDPAIVQRRCTAVYIVNT